MGEIVGDNTSDWKKIQATDYVGWNIYQFSLNYNGNMYTECKYAEFLSFGYAAIMLVLPKDCDNNFGFTFYGVKMENGEPVCDETASLKIRVNGSGSTAPAQQQTEQTEQQQTEQTAQTTTTSTVSSGTPYVTKAGDSLSKIANELCGDSKMWEKIYERNKDLIKNPNLIYSNMNLIMP